MKRLAVLGVAALVIVALAGARADARPRAISATSTVLKVLVDKGGWYRVPMASNGFNPTVLNNVHLKTSGQEVPIEIIGGAVEFYGQALDIPSTDTRTYWLSEDTTPGLRIAVTSRPGPIATPTGTFQAVLTVRDRKSVYGAITNGSANNFFGDLAVIPSQSVTRSINISNADTAQTGATLRVDLHGYEAPPAYVSPVHEVRVTLNGTDLGTVPGNPPSVNGNGVVPMTATFAVPANLLQNSPATNSVLLTNIDDSGTTADDDAVLTDSYILTYPHLFTADSNALEGKRLLENVRTGPPRGGPTEGFPVTPNQALNVDGFTTSDVRVADITNPSSPQEFQPTVSSPPGPFTIGVTPPTGTTRLYAFTGANVLAPKQVLQDTPSSLRTPTNAADLIVIAYADFKAAVQPLIDRRRLEGLTVPDAIDIQDVYDEFGSSFGAKDPAAIREFLQYAKNNWRGPAGTSPAPKYVLLVGDATLDPRNYLVLDAVNLRWRDFIPTSFDFDSVFTPEPPTDNWLVDFNGDNRPELAIGRLPVGTVDETNKMVARIVAYSTSPTRPRTALLISDNFDRRDYDFDSFSLDLQNTSLEPNGVAVTQVPRTDHCPPPGPGCQSPPAGADGPVHAQIMSEASKGPLIVNWFGHGTPTGWAGNPALLGSGDVGDPPPSLTNVGLLSLYLMMTCQNAYFVDPTTQTLSEALLLAESGGNAVGAVAAWASSGDTTPGDQVDSAKLATQELLRFGSTRRLGDAVLVAKNDPTVTDPDVLHTWTLLGDPTTRLPASPTAVTVKSFTAARAARGVEVRWSTARESDVLGFNVYRFAGGTKVKLNRSLIAAKRSGNARGASYKLVDRRTLRGRVAYTYRLETISLAGKRSWTATTALRVAK